MPYFLVAVAAFLATYLCVPPVKLLARRLGAIDYPSKRRINTKPIPRLGGLAMFAGSVSRSSSRLRESNYSDGPPFSFPIQA